MPRFKVLKGVAHNVGHSFTSLMNYSVDDYTMGHILRFARDAGTGTLTIDLLTGQGFPGTLLRQPISELPTWYAKMFRHLVQSSGSDTQLVQSATLTLTYDLTRTHFSPSVNSPQSPYTCDVSITDVRGKRFSAHFEGWWYVEKDLQLTSVRRLWWNPISWLRKIDF